MKKPNYIVNYCNSGCQRKLTVEILLGLAFSHQPNEHVIINSPKQITRYIPLKDLKKQKALNALERNHKIGIPFPTEQSSKPKTEL